MNSSWEKLLNKLGIAKFFTDAVNSDQPRIVADKTLLKMVNFLGFNIKNKEDSAKLLEKLENKRWQHALEPIYVVRQNAKKIELVIKKSETDKFDLNLSLNGNETEVEYTYGAVAEKQCGRTIYQKIEIEILTDLAPQYYDVKIITDKQQYKTVLAVTPDECYIPQILTHKKLWGFAVQLYALNSDRNWGIGDFTDLENLIKFCADKGADVIGINPLNVLFHDYPENASPYSSISRLFLNPIYIDVEKVDGYKSEMLHGHQDILQKVRQSKDIDYTAVYNLKLNILQQIFKNTDLNNDAEYKQFCADKGADLQNLAVYQAMYSHFCNKVYGGWHAWPDKFKNPQTKAVADFATAHSSEITFFKYLQYIAQKQLDAAAKLVKDCRLNVGLYRDLPVGLCKDSVELWAEQDLFIRDCGAGAPPDVFFPKGQKWCLGAFNPYTLKANAYMPFIKILRAAMQNAGALRIDHVMSLMRLYVIPDCDDEGTYIYYNFDDMLGLVALESVLNKCMVVGESIGNVPDGFIEKINSRGIYSLSVLWAERWNGCGDFKQPYNFARKAFCSVGTHDMAPLKMRWFGYDIETMYRLQMINKEERYNQYKGREDERSRLLKALDEAGTWPADKPRQGDCLYGEGYPNGIMEAVESYVSSSCAEVYLMQFEDVLGVIELQNLPGTDRDKHPNWRRKLPLKMEKYNTNDDLLRAISALRR